MIRQRTIKSSVTIEGAGLQTGKKVTLRLKGAPVDSGITFIRKDLAGTPPLKVGSGNSGESGLKKRRTAIGPASGGVETTEHFMAALAGLSIDNITAEIDGAELPGLDGSAQIFVAELKKAGIIEQDAERRFLKIDRAVSCEGENGAALTALPADDFKISYTLSYKNAAIGTQSFNAVIDEETFVKEIAPARTFCLKGEALMLRALGLGRGANYENTLVMGRSGPVKNVLRFDNEPARHKVLDLIGDLYLLGMPIKAHVIAVKSGHRLNMELVKKLRPHTSVWGI